MSDDLEFIGNVKALADNGTLHRLLDGVELKHTQDWKNSTDPVRREKCWYMVEAIADLRAVIKGLTTDDKVREFNQRLRRAS